MTDDDLNRRLAEALEPDPERNAGYRHPKMDNSHLLSVGGMWYYYGGLMDNLRKFVPRDFCRDGNAMLALIECMRTTKGLTCVFEADGEIGYRCEFWVPFEPDKNPGIEEDPWASKAKTPQRAVAEAAVKALGVWEE